jgi:hypothetical protein
MRAGRVSGTGATRRGRAGVGAARQWAADQLGSQTHLAEELVVRNTGQGARVHAEQAPAVAAECRQDLRPRDREVSRPLIGGQSGALVQRREAALAPHLTRPGALVSAQLRPGQLPAPAIWRTRSRAWTEVRVNALE